MKCKWCAKVSNAVRQQCTVLTEIERRTL